MAIDDLTTEQITALDNLYNFLPELGKPSGVDNPLLGTLIQTLIDETGQGNLLDDLASVANGLGASLVGLEDAAAVTTGATVEAAIAELSKRDLGAFADITAIKGIAATKRSDGALAKNLTDSALWVFDADSAAAGDDATVLAPTAGTGRWLLAASPSGAPGFGAAGVSTASKGLVLDVNKATDVLRATTGFTVGGTGVPGAAGAMTSLTKNVTAFLDTTAKAIFTVTVPNTQQACRIEVDVEASLGAGGAIGAGESTMATKYIVTLAKTANKAVVAGVSAVIGAANAKVAGADDITSAVVTTTNITGGTGANTIDIALAITRSGAGATNHTAVVAARLLNAAATGITIA